LGIYLQAKEKNVNHFNLIDEPWIPIRSSGSVSLRQIFDTSIKLKNIGGNPVTKISITKFLLALVQTAWAPKDFTQWEKDGINIMSENVLKYLNKNHALFYLYGDKPFLQVPILQKFESEGKLNPVDIGTGTIPKPHPENNPIIFQNQIPAGLSDAQCALFLLSVMNMAFGGKGENGGAPLKGLNDAWVGYEKPSARPGPGVGSSTGYMHSFALGESVLETLWINTLTIEDIANTWKRGIGIPPWENLPITENVANDLKDSYMGCLVGMSRFVLIKESKKILFCDGVRYPTHLEGWVDPSISINNHGKKRKVIWLDMAKKPWRESTSLLSFLSQKNNFRCEQINFAFEKTKNVEKFGVWAGGLKVTYNSGDQNVGGSDDFIESEFKIDRDQMGENWWRLFSTEMQKIDDRADILQKSVANYLNDVGISKKSPNNKETVNKAMEQYWGLCEKKFQILIISCEDMINNEPESLKKLWNDYIIIVEAVYNNFCSSKTGRQIMAWSKNRPVILKESA
jgi:CRISPR system Cascade subunit CasA